MDTTPLKLPIHDHLLFPTVRSVVSQCRGCLVTEIIYRGYRCNEPYCYAWFHTECGEAPLEINHRSHPEHPLLLTNDSRNNGPCVLCGQKLSPPSPCYSCPTCEFKVDLTCGMKPSPPTIEHPMCHEHPLVFLKKRGEGEGVPCELCKDSIAGPSYSCLECDVYFHVDCVHLSKEVNHPCHSSHPLKLIVSDTLMDDAEKSCLICAEKSSCLICQRQQNDLLYHCSICNFTTCLHCTKKPPPLVYEHTKIHKHPLTLFSRRISYTCDVCGENEKSRTYICFQCGFLIHGGCIDLPRVININRHNHRISFTHHLGAGYSKCGVCRQYISQYKGAYSCSVCPNYAVHTRCAVEGWDLIELEGIPDDTEDITPFKVVGDNLICHFSHEEHPLKLHNEDIIHDEYKRCEACSHPVGFGSIYVCEECCFILHEKCANLPMQKRIVFNMVPYMLKAVRKIIYCHSCEMFSQGFQYTSQVNTDIDVHCGSLSEPFVHDGHLHVMDDRCDGCHRLLRDYYLRCDACDFNLCFVCTSLPKKIWSRNDEHPLTLCFGEKANIKYWCDICERELDPSKWFYICSDCGVTLHAQCVLGDFSRFIPETEFTLHTQCVPIDFSRYFVPEIDIMYLTKGEKRVMVVFSNHNTRALCSQGFISETEFMSLEKGEKKVVVVLNNHNTRPLCSQCHSRCMVSLILKDCNEDNDGYLCSYSCLLVFLVS